MSSVLRRSVRRCLNQALPEVKHVQARSFSSEISGPKPPAWRIADSDRWTKVKNNGFAALLIAMVGLTFWQTTRNVRSQNPFRDDPHVNDLINELKKEELIEEERALAQKRAQEAAKVKQESVVTK